ncbi:MAG: DUF5661 family protein, partial [Candidatus Omnitrophota bacterium]
KSGVGGGEYKPKTNNRKRGDTFYQKDVKPHPRQIQIGTEHELEHTSSRKEARKIAMDHLKEDPKYYIKLKKCMNPPKKHYEEFHGTEPDGEIQMRGWVPGGLVCLGRGVDVGYGISAKGSIKDGWYVHDFGKGVKIYRRAKTGENPDKIVKKFPSQLMMLGYNIGFTYENEYGEEIEVRGSQRKQLCVTSDKKTLVVVGSKGVEFVMKGGDMRVEDWIYN